MTEYLSARLGTVPPPRWLMAALPPLARAAPWMLGAALLTAILLLARPRRRARRGPEAEILAAYAVMLRGLARRGWRRSAAETPREFAARAGGLPGVAALTGVVEEALFAPGGATREMAATARQAARALRIRPRGGAGRSSTPA